MFIGPVTGVHARTPLGLGLGLLYFLIFLYPIIWQAEQAQ